MKRRIATLHVTAPRTPAPRCASTAGASVERIRVDAFLLATLAESLGDFGVSASFEETNFEEPLDPDNEGLVSEGVVWLDVSGMGHLYGDEEALARSLLAHTEKLGCSLAFEEAALGIRVVIASGPRVGRLLTAGLSSAGPEFAEFEPNFAFVAAEGETARLLGALPVELLLGADVAFWRRLGIRTVEQLLALPPATVAARLGPRAQEILALARGEDRLPLVPHRPPRTIELGHEWDEACEGLEPLRFVLRGIFVRMEGRLSARGEGATRLVLRFDWQPELGKTASFVQDFALPAPLRDSREFERIAFARLERLTLPGPVFGVTAIAAGLTAKRDFQLELSADPRAAQRQVAVELELPLLVTELESELGEGAVGCLTELDNHCPEERSGLVPWRFARETAKRASTSPHGTFPHGSSPQGTAWRSSSPLDGITRLLPRPVLLALPPLEGGLVELGERVYRVHRVRFAQRLAMVRWWTRRGVSRDYFWVWLTPLLGTQRNEAARDRSGAGGHLECALVYADRQSARGGPGGTERHYVQGFRAADGPDDD